MLKIRNKGFVFTENPVAPSCHASTVVRLSDNHFLTAWFGGTAEGNNDVLIYTSHREKNEWTKPVAVSPEIGIPHWNPVLYSFSEDKVTLFYKLGTRIADWKTMIMESSDCGIHWTEAAELVEGDESGGRGPVKDKPLRLSSGRILAPGSVERGPWRPFVDIREGTSWRKVSIPVADEAVNLIQPSLWEGPEGCVHAFMRSDQGVIYRSDSEDYGENWSEAYPSVLPNNNSGLDLTKMEDGSVVLVCNPIGLNHGARSPLSVFISEDNGDSFKKVMDLETEPGEYSYPAVITWENKIFITYTWKRSRIAFCELEKV